MCVNEMPLSMVSVDQKSVNDLNIDELLVDVTTLD
jgi:hypothetical protein